MGQNHKPYLSFRVSDTAVSQAESYESIPAAVLARAIELVADSLPSVLPEGWQVASSTSADGYLTAADGEKVGVGAAILMRGFPVVVGLGYQVAYRQDGAHEAIVEAGPFRALGAADRSTSTSTLTFTWPNDDAPTFDTPQEAIAYWALTDNARKV